MSNASNTTYKEVVKPSLTPRQRQVLNALTVLENTYNRPCTMFDVASYMGLSAVAYTISGRFGELVKKGFVETNGTTHHRYNTRDCEPEQSTFTLYQIVKETLF